MLLAPTKPGTGGLEADDLKDPSGDEAGPEITVDLEDGNDDLEDILATKSESLELGEADEISWSELRARDLLAKVKRIKGDLQMERQGIEEEFQELTTKRIPDLERQLEDIEKQAREKLGQIHAIQAEMNIGRRILEHAQQLEAEVAPGKFTELQALAKELTQLLTEYAQKIHEAQVSFKADRNHLAEIQVRKTDLIRAGKGGTEELRAVVSEENRYQDRMREKDAECKFYTAEQERAQKMLAFIQGRIRRDQVLLGSVRSQFDQVVAAHGKAIGEYQTLERQETHLRTGLTEARERKTTLERGVSERQEVITNLSRIEEGLCKISSLLSRAETARKQGPKAEDGFHALQRELQEIKAEFNRQIAALTNEVTRVQHATIQMVREKVRACDIGEYVAESAVGKLEKLQQSLEEALLEAARIDEPNDGLFESILQRADALRVCLANECATTLSSASAVIQNQDKFLEDLRNLVEQLRQMEKAVSS